MQFLLHNYNSNIVKPTYIGTHMYTYTYIHVYKCIHISIHIYICIYIHIHTCIYAHLYIHKRVGACIANSHKSFTFYCKNVCTDGPIQSRIQDFFQLPECSCGKQFYTYSVAVENIQMLWLIPRHRY